MAHTVAREEPGVPVHLGSGLDSADSDLAGIDRQLLADAGAPLPAPDLSTETAAPEHQLDATSKGGKTTLAPVSQGALGSAAENDPAERSKRKRRRIGVDIAFILGMGSTMAVELLQGSSGGHSGPAPVVSAPGGEPVGGSPTDPSSGSIFPPRRPRQPTVASSSGSSSGSGGSSNSGGGQNGGSPTGSAPGTGSGSGGTGPGSGSQAPPTSGGTGQQNPISGTDPVTSSAGNGNSPSSEPPPSGEEGTPPPFTSNPPSINVVPEPDFRPLLVLGVAAIGIVRWRIRRPR